MKIQLKHSDVVSGSTSVAPAAEYLLDGELAVAFNSFDPKIFFKTSDDTLVYLKAYSVDDDVTAVKLDVARTITLTGDVTGSFTFDGSTDISFSTTVDGGNADTLEGSNKAFFRNASNINTGILPSARLSGTYNISNAGNSTTATRLETGRSITLTGDVAGTATFDGASDIDITATVADNSHNHTSLTGITSLSGSDFSLQTNVTNVADDGTSDSPYSRLNIDSLHSNGLGVGQSWIEGSNIDFNTTGYIGTGQAGGQTHHTVVINNPKATVDGSSTSYAIYHDNYHPTADSLTSSVEIALIGDVTGSVSFDGSTNVNISTTVDGGNADTLEGSNKAYYRNATNLNSGIVPTARLSGTYNIDTTGNAATATALETSREIRIRGDVTGEASFDGTEAITIDVVIGGSNVVVVGDQVENSSGNWHTFVNDGGGNIGQRWNSTKTGTNRLVEDGHAWELQIDNDSANGSFILSRSNTSQGLANNLINWVPAVTIDYQGIITGKGNGLTGVNADLLDGQQGSYYQNAGNLTGTINNSRLPSDISVTTVTTTGDITSGANLLPDSDNSGSVGTSGRAWNNGRFTDLTIDSTLSVRGAIDLADGDILRFGSSDDLTFNYNSNNWLYVNFVNGNGFVFRDNGTDKMILEDSGIFRPSTTNTGTLGTSSKAWNNTYTRNVTSDSNLTVQSAVADVDTNIKAGDNIILTAGTSVDGSIYFRGSSAADTYRFSKSGQNIIEGFLSFESLSADRTFTFPNASGTIALTSSTVANATNADTLDNINSTSFLRSDSDDTFTGTITGISDSVNPVITIDGDGPNIIRFPDNGSNTLGIDLVFRVTPHTLGFEKSTDGTKLWETDCDTGVTNFHYTPTVSGNNILTTANEGSGNGLDADTVDSLQASSFLRSDQNDTFTGTITGNTFLLGGSQIISSSAKLQVNGFMRTGTIYLHQGNSADANENRALSNNAGVLQWDGSRIFNDGYHPNADTLTTARTISLTGDVTGSTSFNGSANVSITAVVANDSHNHAFNNLTGKTSGTGEYSTDYHLVSGRGSGGVALTINDGYGNANVTFNHKDGRPEQTGRAGRIEVNTDSTSGDAFMYFELGNATANTQAGITNILTLSNGTSNFTSSAGLTFDNRPAFNGGTSGSTSPFTVDSTQVVTNLNADLLDGQQGSYYRNASNINAGTIDIARLPNTVVKTSGNQSISDTKTFTGAIKLNDNNRINFGTSSSISLRRDSTNLILDIPNNGTFFIRDTSGTAAIKHAFNPNGNYTAQGTVTANLFSGDGSSLTSVDADTLDGINSGSFLRSDAIDVVNAAYTEFGGSAVSASEGGEIRLTSPSGQSNGATVIDMNGVNLRFFYAGSPNKGAYLPLTSLADGVGSRILTTSDEGSGKGLDADTLDGVQASSFLRSNAADTFSGDLTSSGSARILLKKTDNNVSDHIQFYNGTTRVGEIGCHDTTWLRINNVTAKNIYTPRYIRADGGFFVDGTSKGINGSGNFVGGTIAGASDYGTLLRSNANDSASGLYSFAAGAYSANVTYGDWVIQTNLDIQSTSMRGGVLVRNMNDFRSETYSASFMHYDAYNTSDTSYAFRAAKGTTLSDTFWVKGNGAAYFGNDVTIDNTLSVRGAIDLADGDILRFGSSDDVTFNYNNNNWLYVNFVNGNGFVFRDNGTDKMILEDSGIFRPSTTNTGTLGTSSRAWNNIYTRTLTSDSALTIQSAVADVDTNIKAGDNLVLTAGTSVDGSIYFRGDSGADTYRFAKGGQTSVEGFLSFQSLSADRTFTFQNASGTIALTDNGSVSKVADQMGNATGNWHCFVNDGGGNIGQRWNSTTTGTNYLVENGIAYALVIDNDSANGDYWIKRGKGVNDTAGGQITWSNAFRIVGSDGGVRLYYGGAERLVTSLPGVRIESRSDNYWGGVDLRSNYASASKEAGFYLDFKNESDFPKSHIHCILMTNGESRLRFGITAANVSRTTDSRTQSMELRTDGVHLTSGWFRTYANNGLYFGTHGGGWYMTDSTWIRSYGNKSIYHNTGALRTDGTLQVGNNGSTLNVPNGGTATINGNRILTTADEGNFLRSDSSDTTSGNLTINGVIYCNEINDRTGQQLILNAGEAQNKFGDQTGEWVYVNAEGGLFVSTPDSAHSNFQSGYTQESTSIKGRSIGVKTTPGNSLAGRNACIAIGDSDTGIAQNGDGKLELWANNAVVMRFQSDRAFFNQGARTRSNIQTGLDEAGVYGANNVMFEATHGTTSGGTALGGRTYIRGNNAANTTVVFEVKVGTNNKIRFRADGNGLFDGGADIGNADYAEYFEWEDGNPDNEDRRGMPVVLVEDKIRIALTEDDPNDIIGVISAAPGVVGDSAEMGWHKQYLTDEYGSKVTNRREYLIWNNEETDPQPHNNSDAGVADQRREITENFPNDLDDEVPSWAIENNIRGYSYEQVLNPDYDPNRQYIPRSERPEWDTVGLMGKLIIRNGMPVNQKWKRMKTINDSLSKWLVM